MRSQNDKTKKKKKNGPYNTTQKTEDQETRTPLKQEVNSGAVEVKLFHYLFSEEQISKTLRNIYNT